MPLVPSTMTVQNVLDAVKRLFGDESGAQLTDTDIIRWINEGQLEIARKNNYNETTVTTPSVANQAAYNFSGTNILSIQALSYNDYFIDNKTFEQVQTEFLNSVGPVSIPTVLNTSIPLVWYEFGDSIYFWPVPPVAGDTIKLFVRTYPTKLTSAADNLSIPDTYYKALLDFIMSRAYEMDDDLQSSQVRMQDHEKTIGDLAATAKAVQDNHYTVITVMPEDL